MLVRVEAQTFLNPDNLAEVRLTCQNYEKISIFGKISLLPLI